MNLAARPFWQELWEQTKALSLAVGVHVLAAALIVLGTLSWKPFKPPVITGMTIEAVMVDTQVLKDRQEAERRAAADAQRQQERREQRQRELDAQRERERQQAAEDERQRRAAELEAQRKAAEEAERKRQADLRLQQLRQQQERERQEQIDRQQAELEKIQKQREEAERQRKVEEERLKQIEAQKQREAERVRQQQAEAALQQQIAAEEAAARAGALGDLRSQYISAIAVQVTQDWLRPPTARPGLRCNLHIVQIPGGEVISAGIRGSCNADEATRRSLIAAVERSGSLPYRGFEEVFEREINFEFRYDGE